MPGLTSTGTTSTSLCVTFWMRQTWAPRVKVSPTLRLPDELFVQFADLGLGIRHPQIVIAAVRDGPARQVEQTQHPLPAVDGVVDLDPGTGGV